MALICAWKISHHLFFETSCQIYEGQIYKACTLADLDFATICTLENQNNFETAGLC